MARAREHISYERVALAIALRRFPTLCALAMEDVRQECAMLAWEAAQRNAVVVGTGQRRKRFGPGLPREKKGTMGLRSFSRAAYARLYRVARNYGYRRIRHDRVSGEA
jgi:hypothetical protein